MLELTNESNFNLTLYFNYCRIVELAVGRLATRYATFVFLLHHDLVSQAKLRLALHVHANHAARIARTMLTALRVPHLAVVMYASEVLAVFAHLRLALRTTSIRFSH